MDTDTSSPVWSVLWAVYGTLKQMGSIPTVKSDGRQECEPSSRSNAICSIVTWPRLALCPQDPILWQPARQTENYRLSGHKRYGHNVLRVAQRVSLKTKNQLERLFLATELIFTLSPQDVSTTRTPNGGQVDISNLVELRCKTNNAESIWKGLQNSSVSQSEWKRHIVWCVFFVSNI